MVYPLIFFPKALDLTEFFSAAAVRCVFCAIDNLLTFAMSVRPVELPTANGSCCDLPGRRPSPHCEILFRSRGRELPSLTPCSIALRSRSCVAQGSRPLMQYLFR